MPTMTDLDRAALADLRADAEQAEAQAMHGPHYPDRGITADSLRAYANKCRAAIARYQAGGAHRAILAGACD